LNQEGRGWLGFRWRETNDLDPSPNARKKRTTQFNNQTFPFTGTPSETHVYDATNPASPVEFAETAQLYNNPAPQPFPGRGIYFVQLQRTDSFEWDGVGAARQSAKTFEYDARNNLKRTQSLGDLTVNNDQRDEVTEWAFLENATTFLDRPTHTRLFDGDYLAGGNLVREKWLFYDNQNWGVLGTRGLVTREESRATLSDNVGSANNPFVTYGYDDFGNRTSTDDARVCPTTTIYETAFNTYPQTITNCLSQQTVLGYNASFGVVTSQQDANSQLTTSDYDPLGRLIKVTGPLDGTSTYGTLSRFYLDWGNPSLQRIQTYRTEQHGTGNVIWSEEFFDGLGRTDQTRQEGPDGTPILTETLYYSSGQVRQKSAPHFDGETAQSDVFIYDVLGRLTQVSHPDTTYLTKQYTHGTVTTVNERLKPRDEVFDVYGQLKQVIEHDNGTDYPTTYVYDAAGSLLTVTNALGDPTSMTYDLVGRKTQMQDPSMGTWTYEYWRWGDLKKQTDANTQTLCFNYDELKRPILKTKGSTCATTLVTWRYDTADSGDAPVPNATGRLTKVVDNSAVTRILGYDEMGRVTQTQRNIDGSLPYVMSQTYDALSRIATETFPDNDTVYYNYNSAGWLCSVGTSPSAICAVTGGYVNNISYNARGQRTSLAYANGLNTTWTYDPSNFRLTRRQTTTVPAHTSVPLLSWSGSWTVEGPYTPAGFSNLYRGGICVGDGAGNCIGGDSMLEAGIGAGTFLGYVKNTGGAGTVPVYQSTCYSSGGSCTAWGLSLDANGTAVGYLSTMAPDGPSAASPFVQSNGLLLQGLTGTASAYLWSPQTQLIGQNDHYYLSAGSPPGGYTSQGITGYIDDVSSGGTVALTRYVNSETPSHHYYSTSSDPPSGFTGEATVGYLHTVGGSGLTALYRHFNSATGDYLVTTASTPPSGYVMQATLGYIHTSSSTGSAGQDLTYNYDEVGNITAIADALETGSRSFTYDDLNRLKTASGTFGPGQPPTLVTNQTYLYDAIGNILQKGNISYCYGYDPACSDTAHRYAVKFTTDGINQTNYTYDNNGNTLTGAGRSFTWDADNRAETVNGALMYYDYTGTRVKKGATIYPFTGYEDRSGTITKYIRIGNEIIASKESTSTTSIKRFYHNDHLGSINVVSDLNGYRLELFEYDPWGKISRSEGAGDPNHRFTGQEFDSDADIHYYVGRYYDQNLGRFISSDPYVEDPDDPQNLNRYSYVINNPQNFIDPSGYSFWSWLEKVFGFAGKALPKIGQAIIFADPSDLATCNPLCQSVRNSEWIWDDDPRTGEPGPRCKSGCTPDVLEAMEGGAANSASSESWREKWANIGASLGDSRPPPDATDLMMVFAGSVGTGGLGTAKALVPKGAVPLGKWGETRLAQVLGGAGYKPNLPFMTSAGPRYIDRLVNGIAHEVKGGLNVSLTRDIERQILKDFELIQSGQIRGAHWHFFQGAQRDVLEFLNKLGIPYTVY
jgi:RHS repeat-associated protein